MRAVMCSKTCHLVNAPLITQVKTTALGAVDPPLLSLGGAVRKMGTCSPCPWHSLNPPGMTRTGYWVTQHAAKWIQLIEAFKYDTLSCIGQYLPIFFTTPSPLVYGTLFPFEPGSLKVTRWTWQNMGRKLAPCDEYIMKRTQCCWK